MLNLLKRLFAPKGPSLAELLADGALVVDVRTPQEYRSGHVKGSRNIPLSSLSAKTASLKKQKKPIVTCCASGMRSGKAAKLLRQAGLDAHNGGPWQNVERAHP
jgi:phage shock protein E